MKLICCGCCKAMMGSLRLGTRLSHVGEVNDKVSWTFQVQFEPSSYLDAQRVWHSGLLRTDSGMEHGMEQKACS